MVKRKKGGLVVTGCNRKTEQAIKNVMVINGVQVDGYIDLKTHTTGLFVHSTLKALRSHPNYLKGINYKGNKKLVNTDKTKYIIWNIPAVRTCPYATELCKGSCYARSSEDLYPNVKKCRSNNFEISKGNDFTSRVIYTLVVEVYLTNKYTGVKSIRFRPHESGDFYNQAYTDKWFGVFGFFKFDKRIVFDLYSKSLPYFEKYNAVDGIFPGFENVAFKASVWADTKQAMLDLIEKHGYRVYTAGTPEEVSQAIKNDPKIKKCRCYGCGDCNMCASNFYKYIMCVIH